MDRLLMANALDDKGAKYILFLVSSISQLWININKLNNTLKNVHLIVILFSMTDRYIQKSSLFGLS